MEELLLANTGLQDAAAVDLGQALKGCSALTHLDLSSNTICDTGATTIAAALEGGACPRLQLVSLVNNMYPFDWELLQRLQRLEVLRPGLKVDLGIQVLHAAASLTLGRSTSTALLLPAWSNTSADSGQTLTTTPAAAAAGGGSCSEDGQGLTGQPSGSQLRRSPSCESDWSNGSSALCGVCLDQPNMLHIKGCSHTLCVDCYRQLCKLSSSSSGAMVSSSSSSQAKCPFCRGPIEGFMYGQAVIEAAAALSATAVDGGGVAAAAAGFGGGGGGFCGMTANAADAAAEDSQRDV